MSMLDSLRSKLGIDPDADSYVDDTEENVFPGGQGAANYCNENTLFVLTRLPKKKIIFNVYRCNNALT